MEFKTLNTEILRYYPLLQPSVTWHLRKQALTRTEAGALEQGALHLVRGLPLALPGADGQAAARALPRRAGQLCQHAQAAQAHHVHAGLETSGRRIDYKGREETVLILG